MRQSISQLKSEKAKFVNYFVRVENNKRIEKQNMFQVLNEYASTAKTNDEIVKSNIDIQKERLRERLRQKGRSKRTQSKRYRAPELHESHSSNWINEIE